MITTIQKSYIMKNTKRKTKNAPAQISTLNAQLLTLIYHISIIGNRYSVFGIFFNRLLITDY